MYDIWIPSCRPQLAEEARQSLLPYEAKIYDGTNYQSFSMLINHCIINSKNEIIIICNDKIRAKPENIDKIIILLNQGFGIVGLNRFYFFGFKKDFIRKIGFFDERFIKGEYEDNDIIVRAKEANIAHYMVEEISCTYMIPTLWNSEIARKHFFEKWEFNLPVYITRMMLEEDYSYKYNIGEYQKTNFLSFDKSVMCKYCDENWITTKVEISNNIKT